MCCVRTETVRANERVDEGTMCMSANVVANLSNNLKDTFMKSMFVLSCFFGSPFWLKSLTQVLVPILRIFKVILSQDRQ